jgi:hypothetical protein
MWLRNSRSKLLLIQFPLVNLVVLPALAFFQEATVSTMIALSSDAKAYNDFASASVDIGEGHVSSNGLLTGEYGYNCPVHDNLGRHCPEPQGLNFVSLRKKIPVRFFYSIV